MVFIFFFGVGDWEKHLFYTRLVLLLVEGYKGFFVLEEIVGPRHEVGFEYVFGSWWRVRFV